MLLRTEEERGKKSVPAGKKNEARAQNMAKGDTH